MGLKKKESIARYKVWGGHGEMNGHRVSWRGVGDLLLTICSPLRGVGGVYPPFLIVTLGGRPFLRGFQAWPDQGDGTTTHKRGVCGCIRM